MMETGRRLTMIFHSPFTVSEAEAVSANMARPAKMLSAFQQTGFRVVAITGSARQRRIKIRRFKRSFAEGFPVDFVYSESSNLPLFFSENNRLPLFPFMEYRFFRWLRKRNIPVGLFLRDLHWRFPHFRHYPLYKRLPAIPFYWLDWLLYMSRCDRLFLPSAGLAEHLPTKPRWAAISILPPGCEDRSLGARPGAERPGANRLGLTLFYVGGVTPPLYDLGLLFACLRRLTGETAVVCCRQEEWLQAGYAYGRPLPTNVRIIHAHSEELEPYYRDADLFLFALKPYEYLNLAMPYKIFEAVSYLLPILTFAGSAVARWVEAEGAGWVVQNLEQMISLIGRLRENRELLSVKRDQLKALAAKHSWANRAREVAATLGAAKGRK